ncbi:CBASS cGAMP synthase [Psychrobium sp. 1_MG-2023]|uniref:CBASS cGAMP synthase n=1 Tax=Psychrobium sp. 1_MG-2023 TaxID=3062624 RepID=UPI0027348C10|nr:CBASS cGAMP synthase [Psychrobium sp. 1_MG-2023]MDP2560767.1 CBASS cGAMP synthase [Psychrobium sp. 1_MG-2023]
MKYNATPLLSKTTESFLPLITPTPYQIKELKEYRRIVREAVRNTFRTLNNAFEQDMHGKWQLSEKASQLPFAERLRQLNPAQKATLVHLKPKFNSQGSFVYKTLNLPCHKPPQQIDLDDGVYLPLDIFRDSPIVSKDLFFFIVDNTLIELAEDMGWKFKPKNTCARLIVSDLIHIDIPLYAIPLERHTAMLASMDAKTINNWLTDSRALLARDDVYLAVRDSENWVVSDPATISEWFKSNINMHGEILRNVCRHLKAWRDYRFPSGGPSSIALMACAVKSFNDITVERGIRFVQEQESEALMLCANRLGQQLIDSIPNPTDERKPQLYPQSNMSDTEINQHYLAAEALAEELSFALKQASNKQETVDSFRRALGERVPNRQDMIHVVTGVTADIMSKPAKTNPAPVVPNGDAG